MISQDTVQAIYREFVKADSITTDSRKAMPGVGFFALRGERFDGNDFLTKALEAGAPFVVADDASKAPADKRVFLVEDTLEALSALARHHRLTLGIPILAITGTNGKTTTKELVRNVLSCKYRLVATEGNYNNHIGVPLTLLSLKEDTQMAVVEMGANHPGEIATLCRIAEPDYGIITNVGMAHLEGFGSFEGVKKTKKELYDFLASRGGKAFVNRDNANLMEMSAELGSDRIFYGITQGEGKTVLPVSSDPYLKVRDGAAEIQTHLTGLYNTENIAAALAAGEFFRVDPSLARSAVMEYIPGNSRSQIVKTQNNTLLCDLYNANLTSMTASLENFLGMTAADKVVILGQMGELGAYSDQAHRKILSMIEGKVTALLIGDAFSRNVSSEENVLCFDNLEQVQAWLQENPLRNKTILIKGSRTNQLENLVKLL